MTQSLVSVVVTTYNHGQYIAETLHSVFRQTYPHYEVIVVDDGSTDDTVSRLSAFQGRLRCIRQANRGPAGSRNTGVHSAGGDFLAFLDGDDIWEPTKLEAQVAAAQEHPGSGLIATDGVQFSTDGLLNHSLLGPSIRTRLARSETLTCSCYEQLIRGNVISTTSQVMIPRSVLERVGPSDPAFRISSDWDLYLRIAEANDFTFVRHSLVRWRYLATSTSGPAHSRPLRWATDEIAVLKKHVRRASPPSRRLVRTALRAKLSEAARTAYHYGRARDKHWARRYLLDLLTSNPSSTAPALYLVALALPASAILRVSRLARGLLCGPSRADRT